MRICELYLNNEVISVVDKEDVPKLPQLIWNIIKTLAIMNNHVILDNFDAQY